MSLIRTEGSLVVYHPAADGIPTVQGFSRDWYPSAKWESAGGCEFIKPINAIAPAGDLRTLAMTATFAIHASYNQSLRQIITPGNPPVASYEFYDNSAYASGTAITTYMGVLHTNLTANFWQPNFTMRLTRYAPPPNQGIVPRTVIVLLASVRVSSSGGVYYLDRNGSWTNGQVTLRLPFQSPAYKTPTLAWQAGAFAWTTWAADFSEGPSGQSLDGGMAREGWVFEYVQDTDRFDGGHILIRNSANPGDWWHTYNENVRLTAGPVRIGMAGCRQILNFAPIPYADSTPNAVSCWAKELKPLPGASYEDTASWAALTTDAANWTVTVADKDDATVQAAIGYRPAVTFTPTVSLDTTRPVLWQVAEDHPATIAVPAGLPAAEDTDGDAALVDLSLHFDDTWRNAGGTATFKRSDTALYPDWLERGKVECHLGWQPDPDPGADMVDQNVATLWIAPGGIVRDRRGEEQLGAPGLRVELADLVRVKLQESCIVDLGEASGVTAGTWFDTCGNRMGLPATMIDVAAAIAAQVLPSAEPCPSTPHLKPQDGQSWEQHLDEVCKASGLRWGYNPHTVKLFLDGGRPEYVPGTSTISFVLDYDTLLPDQTPFDPTHIRDNSGHRNRYKILYGPEDNRKAYYWTADSTEIQADGGDYWAVADETNGDTVAEMQADLDDQHRTRQSLIVFEIPLRVGLRCEQFVQIGDCPEMGLEVGAIYQISELDHSRSGRRTRVAAKRVYSPGGYY